MTDSATTPHETRMTVAELLEWQNGREGRYELLDGEVIRMQAEQKVRAIVKGNALVALRDAIHREGLPCRAWPDGATVAVGNWTRFEPDASVTCGEEDFTHIALDNPVIVVEVESPSSSRIDNTTKLTRYFQVPTIEHYLVVNIDRRLIVHYRRQEDGAFARFHYDGMIALDPPGLSMAVAAIFADLPDAEDGEDQSR